MSLLLKEHDISPQQGRIVVFLYHHQNEIVNQKVLQENFDITKAAISGLIKRLIKKGYIISTKDPNDARNNHLKLTEEGVGLYFLITESMQKINELVISSLKHTSENELKDELLNIIEGLSYAKNIGKID